MLGPKAGCCMLEKANLKEGHASSVNDSICTVMLSLRSVLLSHAYCPVCHADT